MLACKTTLRVTEPQRWKSSKEHQGWGNQVCISTHLLQGGQGLCWSSWPPLRGVKWSFWTYETLRFKEGHSQSHSSTKWKNWGLSVGLSCPQEDYCCLQFFMDKETELRKEERLIQSKREEWAQWSCSCGHFFSSLSAICQSSLFIPLPKWP